MVTAVKSQGGFDSTSSATSDAVILSWLNARYYELCAESAYTQAIRELGPTVAGTSEYALPDAVVRVKSIKVDGSRPWIPLKLEDVWELEAGSAQFTLGAVGGFAETFTEISLAVTTDGVPQVKLFPTPTESGLTIKALCIVRPNALDASTDIPPTLPDDFHEYLVEGAIAMGLRRDDEREDGAAPYEARFKEAIQRLAARQRKRVGRGPIQARVSGYQTT